MNFYNNPKFKKIFPIAIVIVGLIAILAFFGIKELNFWNSDLGKSVSENNKAIEEGMKRLDELEESEKPQYTTFFEREQAYQSIFDEYTKKLNDSSIALAEEYKKEAEQSDGTKESLEKIYDTKADAFLSILTDGISEMASYLMDTGEENKSQCEYWGNKLVDAYSVSGTELKETYNQSIGKGTPEITTQETKSEPINYYKSVVDEYSIKFESSSIAVTEEYKKEVEKSDGSEESLQEIYQNKAEILYGVYYEAFEKMALHFDEVGEKDREDYENWGLLLSKVFVICKNTLKDAYIESLNNAMPDETLTKPVTSTAETTAKAATTEKIVTTEKPEVTTPEAPETKRIFATAYQSIYDEYTVKLHEAALLLVEEYKSEAVDIKDDYNGLSELYLKKTQKLSETLNDGLEEFAKYYLTSGASDDSEWCEYEDKLCDAYFSECELIFEAECEIIMPNE